MDAYLSFFAKRMLGMGGHGISTLELCDYHPPAAPCLDYCRRILERYLPFPRTRNGIIWYSMFVVALNQSLLVIPSPGRQLRCFK